VNILESLTPQQILQLNHPEDFFVGREKTSLPSPTNILLFHRDSVEELIGEQESSFHHHRFVFIHCIRGNGNVLINDAVIPMSPGRSCLIFPYELHYFSNFETEEVSWLIITFECEINGLPGTLKTRSWRPHARTQELLRELLACWISGHPGLTHYLSLVLIEARHMPGKADAPQSASTFVAVNQILNKHAEHPWSIDEIAREVGYSPGHLRLLFRKEVKVSIGRYIRRYRTLRAANLLQATRNRIGEISDMCGFESHYAFSRTFKREMGQSPKAYRDAIQTVSP
jgi:AraC-like DNA-binding protein